MAAIDLGYRPREWQRRAHLEVAGKRESVVVLHRRGGKTVFAVMHLIHAACVATKPNSRFAYVAPYLKQAKAIAWSYLKQYATRIPGTVVNESELHVTLPNGSQIRLYGADNPESLRGIYLDGLVMDELADVAPDVWYSILLPTLSDRKGWCIFMGTPKGINLLSEVRQKAMADRKNWGMLELTCYQTGALDDQEIERMRDAMGEERFRREMLCDFNASAGAVLLSVDDVERSCKRTFRLTDNLDQPKIFGVDVARQGDDRTVIYLRQGRWSERLASIRCADTMQTAANVAHLIQDNKPDAVFVDGTGGYGAGVIDRLRQLQHNCIEVQFGGKADDPRYANRRTEMHFKLSQWIKNEGRIPDDIGLKQELCAPFYGYDRKGRMILEPKDDIKERIERSPDEADALALTFAYAVAAKPVTLAFDTSTGLYSAISTTGAARCVKDYDPLAFLRR